MRMLVDAGVPVADLLEAARHRGEREIRGIAIRHFLPGQRGGHARLWRRTDRIGRSDGAVLRVLVVVDEYAVALLLPPLAGGELGRAALDLARERERGAAHVVEFPARLDAHGDMQSALAGGLGP